jgi:hypothetical protein
VQSRFVLDVHVVGQQVDGGDVEPVRDALEASQRQVPLAALDAAQVGPMDSDRVGEVFLGQSPSHSDRPHVRPDRALQVAFHLADPDGALLVDLQTDK